jgi:putative solute:sodium symporter small subunit
VAETNPEKRRIHWAKTRRLTFIILALWFIFAFVLPWFAKDLNAMSFIGFKLGYYFVVQGSLIAFVLMILAENLIQDRIDDEYGAGSVGE